MPNVRLSFTCWNQEQDKGLDQGVMQHLLYHKPAFTFESSFSGVPQRALGHKDLSGHNAR